VADHVRSIGIVTPGTYDRLAALKRIHAPRNLFRRNRDIRPGANA
jgi:hypothetical protein